MNSGNFSGTGGGTNTAAQAEESEQIPRLSFINSRTNSL
jgi:hypothetical protein